MPRLQVIFMVMQRKLNIISALIFVLNCAWLSSDAQVLSVEGHAFYLNEEPFDMWGVRVASAAQHKTYTRSLIANLNSYKSAGINTISVFLQGSSGGFTDPFQNSGLSLERGHWKRLKKIVRACAKRQMAVIVGIFYQRTVKDPEISNLKSELEIRNAVRTTAEKLKPYRNVIINIANEQNSSHYREFEPFDFNKPENIISLCQEVKKVDPNRIVGGGGYQDSLNVIIGKSEFVDVLLFDTFSKDIEHGQHSGWHYDFFREQGVPDKPIVNVELFGGWTRQFMPPGVYTEEGKAIHYQEIEAAKNRPGLSVHLHSNPWFQALAQGLPNRFDLGGIGTSDDPGVRWFFDKISHQEKLPVLPLSSHDHISGLSVSDDGLRIEKSDGSDWFWLGDTGWSLFQELNQSDAEYYFATRASQGFTVIQAVALMGWNRNWNDANAYGHRPFIDGNVNNPNEKFWQHVDWMIKKAREYGLYVALLPAWGTYWGLEATPDYAKWVTDRYRDFDNIIWVNGGDRKVGKDLELFNEIGRIFDKEEDVLITFHPRGGDHSSKHFHQEEWLDVNMQQSSHGSRDLRADIQVDIDLMLEPTKPTLNGEPNYEDHCVNWDTSCAQGTFNAHDVRQLAYWTVFAGAAGYTYGHVHVWDFYHGGNKEDGYRDWKSALIDTGAVQMKYLSHLMMSRPHKDRAPAQDIIVNQWPEEPKHRAILGDGYVFVYTSQGYNINIRVNELSWQEHRAWWYNPRNGMAAQIDVLSNGGNHIFNPPGNPGNDNDWVLVIDDKTMEYGKPGINKTID